MLRHTCELEDPLLADLELLCQRTTQNAHGALAVLRRARAEGAAAEVIEHFEDAFRATCADREDAQARFRARQDLAVCEQWGAEWRPVDWRTQDDR